MNKLSISGVDVTNEVVTGLETFNMSVRRDNETGTIDRTISTDIELEGEAAQLIKTTFFDDCNNFDKELNAGFSTDICGGISASFVIGADTVTYCPRECKAKVTLKSVKEEDRCFAKLNSTPWWEGFKDSYSFPIVYYCVQNYNSYMIWLLRQLLVLIAAFVLADIVIPEFNIGIPIVGDVLENILNTVARITTVAGSAITVGVPLITNFPGFHQLLALLDNFIAGCGRWVPVVYVRDAINYQANNCGIRFQSSILNDISSPYYDTAIWSLEGSDHGDKDDISAARRLEVFENNAPLQTTIDLLNSIEEMFNAEFRLFGGVLYFEEVEFFENLANIQISDVVDLTKKDYADPCYTFNSFDLCAYGQFTYTGDSFDLEGNKLVGGDDTSPYRDRLEFNDPPSDAQKGICQVSVQYSPIRAMFDQASFDSQGLLSMTRLLDEFRDGSQSIIGSLFGSNGDKRFNDMVLGANQASNYKIFILEPNTNPDDAQIIRREYKVDGGKQFWEYNYPLYFQNENGDDLTSRFLYKLDPRIKRDKMSLDSVSTICECDALEDILNNFNRIYINTHFGKAIPEEVVVDVTPSQINIEYRDIKVYCG